MDPIDEFKVDLPFHSLDPFSWDLGWSQKMGFSWPGWLHPTRAPMKILILLLVCGTTIGSYYSYNSTAVISTTLIKEFGLSQFEYGLIYSVYSIPNLILPLLGGLIVDRIGVRFGLLLFLGLIAFGTGIVAISPYFEKSFPLLLLGRFIFGLGSEASYVAQDTLCVAWFGGSSIAFTFGFISGVERATEFITFNTLVSDSMGSYKLALWCTLFVCIGSFLCGIVACLLDSKAEKILVQERNVKYQHKAMNHIPTNLSDIRKFKFTYWMLVLVMMCFYASIFPFLSFASNFLQMKYNYNEQEAGRAVGLVSIISMILSPMFGFLVDAFGKRIHFINLGNLIQAISFLIMGFTEINPIICLVAVGISYSLIPSALWPSLPIVLKDKSFATASGLALSISNIGMIPVYGIVGQLIDNYHNIEGSLLLLVGVSILGFLFGLIWQYLDFKEGSPCNTKYLQTETSYELL